MNQVSKHVGKIIVIVRASALQEYGDIQLLTEKQREERFGSTEGGKRYFALIGERQYDVVELVSNLIQTPRILKQVLRRVLWAWKNLHGELDFDDLLMATTLQHAATDVYEFILLNIEELRYLERAHHSSHDNEASDKIRAALDEQWKDASKLNGGNSHIARNIVGHLFPGWSTSNIRPRKSPQGVWRGEPTDYWDRLHRGELLSNEETDQEVLRAIQIWKQNHAATAFRRQSFAISLAGNDNLAEKLAQFGSEILGPEQMLELASELFAAMLDLRGASASNESSKAFLVLWRLSLESDVSKDAYSAWATKEIVKALPRSIRFANDIFYYWRSHETPMSGGEREATPQIRQAMVTAIKSLFDTKPPVDLLSALDSNYAYAIYHQVFLFSDSKYGGEGDNPDAWKWLIALLLEAAKIDPRKALIQLIPFVFKIDYGFDKAVKSFDEKRAHEFFGSQLTRFMELVSRGFDLSGLDDQTSALMEYAKTASTDWLPLQSAGTPPEGTL